ncbi:Beta-lactamase domain-containing protein [Aphelenchoides besseyi]|nr:Beta-lactamase domain-containing protein [Aphelenchoides besseyi]KAI6199438.1 Beta-lactamase domain-containing protein [Aphelenchoides besseyi]
MIQKSSYRIVWHSRRMKDVDHIFGTCDPGFVEVEKVFRKNFANGWEREGAEFAVYYDGRLVVDLQGGYKDAKASVPWTDETRTIVFSVTKSIAALCIGLLVDRGRLRYDQKIVEFWPEFGKNGKENITVGCVLTHRSGLTTFGVPMPLDVVRDPQKVGQIIENATPIGTKTAYHALTYGWLVDQIVRHVDEQNRGVSQFFRDEIAQKHDIDFHLGLPSTEAHTVSRLSATPRSYVLREIRSDPRIMIAMLLMRIRGKQSLVKQIKCVSDWMQINEARVTLNNPEIFALEQVAALGITKARELAKLFSLVIDGKVVSSEIVEMFKQPQIVDEIDAAVRAPLTKGHGFMYEKHPIDKTKWTLGHPGFGGSTVLFSPDDRLAISYVGN